MDTCFRRYDEGGRYGGYEWGPAAPGISQGSSLNVRVSAGMVIPGSLREVQICTAPVASTGASSDPALIVTVAVGGSC